MTEKARIVIELHGDNQAETAQAIVHDLEEFCQMPDPEDTPRIYVEVSKDGEMWDKLDI